jgi:hypothetical protein
VTPLISMLQNPSVRPQPLPLQFVVFGVLQEAFA